MVEYQDVYSSNIDKIGYDEERKELHVIWKGSDKHSIYSNVPPETAKQATNSYSVGKAITSDIKPNFSHRYL
jgi:hypothetical protein